MTHTSCGDLTPTLCLFRLRPWAQFFILAITSLIALSAGQLRAADPPPIPPAAPVTGDYLPAEPTTAANSESPFSATLADYDLKDAAMCAKTVLGAVSFDNFGQQVVCGDINNDGFVDMIASAPRADHFSGIRNECGVISIFYGSVSFISDTVNLLTTLPNVRIFGATTSEFAGEGLAFGDVNGDGKGDLVIGAPGGFGPGGTRPNCGRVYIIFNSAGLSSSIDLNTATVTIFGPETGVGVIADQAGSSIAVGKIDADNKLEILIGAPGGDGAANGKIDCGEYHILNGRSPWPATIDLATQADVTIYGPDASDGYYNIDGNNTRAPNTSGIGKLDGDNIGDLALGFPGGDGRNNTAPSSGEVRVLMGANLSATVNLATAPNKFLHGAETLDVLATVYIANLDGDAYDDLFLIPINADGLFNLQESSGEMYIQYGRATWADTINAHFDATSTVYYPPSSYDGLRYVAVGNYDNTGGNDLAIAAYGGDGPNDTRGGCGDVYVFFNVGHVTGFNEIDFVSLIPDALIYGPIGNDKLGFSGLATGDLNNDGYHDLAIGASLSTYSTGVRIQAGKAYVASGKMIAIGDRDVDGKFGCLDNCPVTTNATQTDGDADSFGDVCDNCPAISNANQADGDFDGTGTVCDNCPTTANANQSDLDADGVGDLCDNCKNHYDPSEADSDGDNWGNLCDPCPTNSANNCCVLAGDADNSGSINIGDVTYLILYIFGGGPAPVVSNSGNVDCVNGSDISDAIYLIEFIFLNGEPPCCKL